MHNAACELPRIPIPRRWVNSASPHPDKARIAGEVWRLPLALSRLWLRTQHQNSGRWSERG